MGEVVPPIGEEPLLAVQQQIHDLHKELRGGSSHVQADFDAPAALAVPLRAELASSAVGDLLVAHGEVLQPDMEYYYGPGPRIIRPGLNAELMGVSFGTWGIYNDRRRFVSADQAAELEGRDDVDLAPVYDDRVKVKFTDKYDWNGNVHLTFWYFQHFVSGVSPVGERLTVVTRHSNPGELPNLESSVAIIPGRGGSLTAWPRTERRAQNEGEALVIVDAVRRLKSAKENAS